MPLTLLQDHKAKQLFHMPVPDFCHPKISSRGTKLGREGTEELSAHGGDTEQRCGGEEHKASENLKVNM